MPRLACFACEDGAPGAPGVVRGLVGAGGASAGLYALEEPDDDDATEREQREPAKDVNEGPGGGLVEKLPIEAGRCRSGGVAGAEGPVQEVLCAAHAVLEAQTGLRNVIDDFVLVNVRAANEQ